MNLLIATSLKLLFDGSNGRKAEALIYCDINYIALLLHTLFGIFTLHLHPYSDNYKNCCS